MEIVTHNWNGSAIAQLTKSAKIAKFEIPAGYVNATQMCKACNKQWGHYAELDTTKAYWEALSTDIGIPISSLVFSIKGGNDKQIQGTWTHSEIAMDLAQWVNVEFRIWANRTLKQVILNQATAEPLAQPTTESQKPSLQELSDFYDLTLTKAGIDPRLVAGVKIAGMTRYYPALSQAGEIGKPSLSIPVESNLVRPTALAERLTETTGEKWSAVRVNKTLIEQGFQIKNPDGGNDPAYLPTEKGKEHSQLVVETAKGHGKTVQSLRWHFSVLEALEANDH